MKSFSSFEEAMDEVRKGVEMNRRAAEMFKAEGSGIEPGYACYFHEQFRVGIWGEVFTHERVLETEMISGAEPVEAAETAEMMLNSLTEQGMAYGIWFSQIEPKGEYGSTSVVSLTQIDDEEFERAKAMGWNWERWSGWPQNER